MKLSCLLLLLSIQVFGQQSTEADHFLKPNHIDKLLNYCLDEISLDIPGHEGQVKTSEAQKILANWIKENQIKGYKRLHSGKSKAGVPFITGEISNAKKTFDVYILMQKKGDDYFIELIQIQ